jgi:putative transposase
MKGKMSLSQTARILKGESSYWINQQGILDDHFRWQREFYAAAIAERGLSKVCRYIGNQEKHHAKKPEDQDYVL